jgi:WD40 repeat protein
MIRFVYTLAWVSMLSTPLFAQQPIALFTGHEGPVNCIDLSPDGKTLISGSKDETIRVWNLENKTLLKALSTEGSSVKKVDFNSTGSRFVASLYLRIAEFDSKTFKSSASGEIHTAFVETSIFSPDDKTILTSSWRDNTLSIYKAGTFKKVIAFPESIWVDNAIFNKLGSIVYSGGHDDKIKCWDVKSGQMTRSFSGHDDWVYDVCLSPDESLLYSGSFDKTIRVWEIATGKNLATLKGHAGGIVCIDISSDGKYLASAGADMFVILWDLEARKELRRFKAHEGTIMDLKFSRDGKTLYSCSFDKTIKAWDVAAGL